MDTGGLTMKRIEAEIEIDAPIARVWAVLTDTGEYPAWNPFISSFRGVLRPGAQIEVRIAPPGQRPMTFRPTITEVTDGRALAWSGRLLLPGIFDGRHSFRLESLGAARTRLTQTEEFRGVLVPVAGGLLKHTVAGFEAMNLALRQRAETDAGVRAR
jgi:hypothetical protein